jgi:hypothetical protein
MAKKITLVIPDEIFKHLSQVAAANEKSLSATVATGIECLYWIRKQEEEGFVVKAEKEERDRLIIREITIT